MLVKFKQFVDEITAENGRNYKISVLEKYKEDEDIRYLLNFIYNPYITTGISTKSYSRFHNKLCIDNYPKNIFNSTRDALEYLKVHNTGDDNTRELMFSYYMNIHLYEVKTLLETGQSVDIHELFYYIITKNIQLGIDSKTINKVIPGLIPEFNVQLANKYFDKPEVVEGKEFVLTTKIDGSRIIAMKDDGKVSFWTRQGQKYEGLVDLEKELLECTDDNFVFDGELVAIDTDLENTYICPLLALSHLQYGELGYDDEINLCIDLLSECDRLIVASEIISKGVQLEVDFARLVNMEVFKLEKDGTLQPFTE